MEEMTGAVEMRAEDEAIEAVGEAGMSVKTEEAVVTVKISGGVATVRKRSDSDAEAVVKARWSAQADAVTVGAVSEAIMAGMIDVRTGEDGRSGKQSVSADRTDMVPKSVVTGIVEKISGTNISKYAMYVWTARRRSSKLCRGECRQS